jgi:hypothetical protein
MRWRTVHLTDEKVEILPGDIVGDLALGGHYGVHGETIRGWVKKGLPCRGPSSPSSEDRRCDCRISVALDPPPGPFLAVTWRTLATAVEEPACHKPDLSCRLLRTPRDGTPLDMSNENPELLEMISGDRHVFSLNNPVGDSPAQIAGVDADGVVFRYTLGDAEPELFPELDARGVRNWVNLNDSGTFCGRQGERGEDVERQKEFNVFTPRMPVDALLAVCKLPTSRVLTHIR